MRTQFINGRERQRRIGRLMHTAQRDGDVSPSGPRRLNVHCCSRGDYGAGRFIVQRTFVAVSRGYANLAIKQAKRRAARARGLIDDLNRIDMRDSTDDGDTGLNDARFFPSDLSDSTAKNECVITTDIRNDRHQRSTDVSGIEASSQSCLQHGKVGLTVLEVEPSNGRR